MADETRTADPEALTAWLSEHYRERVRLFAMRRLQDSAAAEDIVQDTLKTVLEALRAGRVREPAAIASFAFETARNLCMHRTRSRSREERALGALATSPASSSADVLTRVISDERRRAVRVALQQLGDDDRRLLVMTFVDDRTAEQIGRELRLEPGAVRVRRHRALKRLSALLDVTIAPDREQD